MAYQMTLEEIRQETERLRALYAKYTREELLDFANGLRETFGQKPKP